MKALVDIQLMYGRMLWKILRNPVFIFMGVTMPVMYLAFFAPILHNFVAQQGGSAAHVLDMFLPGMLSMIALFGGIFSGFGLIDELRSGVIERFRVTPASRFALLAGPVLMNVTAMLVQSLLFILISLPFGLHIHGMGYLVFLTLLILLNALSSSFGYAVALSVKSEDKFAPIVQGINLPILLLSGMLLPITLAPRWLQLLAHGNPVYYVVEAGRQLVLGHIAESVVGYAFLVMVPLTFLTMRWATNTFRRAVM